jgi:sulfofructose kinase
VKSVDVVAFGENSVDLMGMVDDHPQADAKMPLADYRELPGGEAASAAVGLARLGWKTKYIGRFGDDRLGEMCRRHLAHEGVDVSDCIVVENQTSRMAVILANRRSGERTVLWRRDDALALRPEDVSDGALASTRALLVGSDDVAAMTSAARRARRFGAHVFGDLERVHSGTDALLRELDVVVMAATFPRAFTGTSDTGRALREIAEASGAWLVCVTLGKDGCLAIADGRECHVSGFRVDVVDTTGAGDLFRAGLIARWLGTSGPPDVRELLRYANAVAALNCRAIGAHTSAPRPAEVDALLAK